MYLMYAICSKLNTFSEDCYRGLVHFRTLHFAMYLLSINAPKQKATHKGPLHIDWRICIVERQFIGEFFAKIKKKMFAKLVTNVFIIIVLLLFIIAE